MTSPRLAYAVFPNVVAGLTSGLVALVYCVSFSALIFSDKLGPYLPQGLGVALIGAAITSIVVAALSPFPITIAGPEANSAIILALAARSIANAIQPGDEQSLYPTVWAAIVLSTFISGLFLYLLGRYRLGKMARYVPYPVIGGFLAGTGWLITRSSFKVMTGLPLGWAELPKLLQPDLAGQWLVGIAVAMVLFYVLNRSKHFLALPSVLVGGTVLGNVIFWLARRSSADMNAAGWFFEPFPNKGVWEAWTYSTFQHIDWSVLFQQSGTLLAMLVIVMLSILLNSTGLELATSRNVDLNDELRADGIANLASGACGGMVGYLSVNRCALNQRAGATGPLAAVVAGLFCGAVLLFGSSFLAFIPKPLLGGLLLYLGLNLLFRWIYQSYSQFPLFDYMLVMFILVIIAVVGFIPGIGSGILIACILFIVSYGKTSSIKYKLTGATYHSNVVRSDAQREVLRREGDSLTILVLHGFVFFGTANDLLDGIRGRVSNDNRKRLNYALFDFRLVTGLDSSAALSFLKMAQVGAKAGLRLILTNLNPAVEKQLSQGGHFPTFPDLDHGVEWCENQILESEGCPSAPVVPLLSQLEDLFKDPNLASNLLPYLRAVPVADGSYLFHQGEASDGLYFLESGRVSVVVELENHGTLRRRTYTSGTILGEMGFFSGAPRTASVVADENSRLHYLSKIAFEKLEQEAPLLAAHFNKAVVNLVAERLCRSEEEVRTLLH